jgi:hypothetical protein
LDPILPAADSQRLAFPMSLLQESSAITPKPAMRDHFKTGHMIRTQDLHLF